MYVYIYIYIYVTSAVQHGRLGEVAEGPDGDAALLRQQRVLLPGRRTPAQLGRPGLRGEGVQDKHRGFLAEEVLLARVADARGPGARVARQVAEDPHHLPGREDRRVRDLSREEAVPHGREPDVTLLVSA